MASHVLHTNSKWAYQGERIGSYATKTINKAALESDLIGTSKSFLEGQEKQLYAWVGESTYTGFINKLRQEFASHENDVKIFENFKKANLTPIINTESLFGALSEGQKVRLICSQVPTIDIKGNDVAKMLEAAGITVTKMSGNIEINFDYNLSRMKTIMNELDNYNLNPEANSTRATRQHFNDFLKHECFNGTNKIGQFVIGSKGNEIDLTKRLEDSKNNRSPFSYKKEDIDTALSGKNKDGLEQMRQVVRNAHNTLKELCAGGSEILRESFETAWNHKIGSNWNNADRRVLENFLFLSKGQNVSGAAGAIQELLTAMILDTYLKLTLAKFSAPVAKILGNLSTGPHSEQSKSDVEILKTIGIQVKAYNQNSLINKKGQSQMNNGDFLQLVSKGNISTIETNVHPSGLDANLAGHGLYNFGDAIVQCCFNSDNGNVEDLKQTIDNVLLAQAMNLTTNEIENKASQIGNTVCFYFLDGQYLVPGSVLLERLQPKMGPTDVQHAVDITGTILGKGYNDAYFKTENDKGIPNFVNYWTALEVPARGEHHWQPTSDNRSEYEQLYTSGISIRVYFEYRFMYDANYSIYIAK